MGLQPDFGAAFALATKALEAGADRKSHAHIAWDISGDCYAPAIFELMARPQMFGSPELRRCSPEWRRALEKSGLVDLTARRGFEWSKGDNHPLWVTLTVRCRKCEWCLRQRALNWARKAQDEIKASCRTWFATYTGNPNEQYRWLSAARMHSAEGSVPFESYNEQDRFRAICRAAGPDITRYVKRIRKQSGASIRYLIVTEKHQSGLPHWHALIHEDDWARPIRKAVLKEQWVHGFSQFKLVENQGAAWYLCKYLSKDLATRVRSSLQYGRPPRSNGLDHNEQTSFVGVRNMIL